jgi:hypothetical protein
MTTRSGDRTVVDAPTTLEREAERLAVPDAPPAAPAETPAEPPTAGQFLRLGLLFLLGLAQLGWIILLYRLGRAAIGA